MSEINDKPKQIVGRTLYDAFIESLYTIKEGLGRAFPMIFVIIVMGIGVYYFLGYQEAVQKTYLGQLQITNEALNKSMEKAQDVSAGHVDRAQNLLKLQEGMLNATITHVTKIQGLYREINTLNESLQNLRRQEREQNEKSIEILKYAKNQNEELKKLNNEAQENLKILEDTLEEKRKELNQWNNQDVQFSEFIDAWRDQVFAFANKVKNDPTSSQEIRNLAEETLRDYYSVEPLNVLRVLAKNPLDKDAQKSFSQLLGQKLERFSSALEKSEDMAGFETWLTGGSGGSLRGLGENDGTSIQMGVTIRRRNEKIGSLFLFRNRARVLIPSKENLYESKAWEVYEDLIRGKTVYGSFGVGRRTGDSWNIINDSGYEFLAGKPSPSLKFLPLEKMIENYPDLNPEDLATVKAALKLRQRVDEFPQRFDVGSLSGSTAIPLDLQIVLNNFIKAVVAKDVDVAKGYLVKGSDFESFGQLAAVAISPKIEVAKVVELKEPLDIWPQEENVTKLPGGKWLGVQFVYWPDSFFESKETLGGKILHLSCFYENESMKWRIQEVL